MTSNINPNNINGAYPVAGQDNNSQGFRDNFTNTKTNFQYAADEITDLQNKAILSSQLIGGSSLSTQNNMNGSPLSNALISNFATPTVELGTLSGSVTIDYAAGHYQIVRTGGSISLNFTNWPSAGKTGMVTVRVHVMNTAHTITFPTNVNINHRIVGLTLAPSVTPNVLTVPITGHYAFTFITDDQGSQITIEENNKVLQPLNHSAETVSQGNVTPAPISNGYTTSYLEITGSDQEFTLGSGIRGQIKVLSVVNNGGVLGGNLKIAVTGAAWKSIGNSQTVGNIYFNSGNVQTPVVANGSVVVGNVFVDNRGHACILQHGVDKWFVIGNNGAIFD